VRPHETRAWIRDADASFEMNEPDAYALEAALRLKEAHGGEVVAVSAGPQRVTQVLREALARGADRAVHVAGDALAEADAFVIADALQAAVAPESPDLVLTGLQSDDMGFGQVGVVLAERLDVAHATIVMDVQVDGARVRVKRELEGGWFQWVILPTPALLTIQSGINQLRYATLKGIMAANKKELRQVAAPETVKRYSIRALAVPEGRKQTRMIEGTPEDAARELVRALREDARVVEGGA